MLYLSFWVLFVGNKHTPEFQPLKKSQMSEVSLKSFLPNKFWLFSKCQRTVRSDSDFFAKVGFCGLFF